MKKYLIVIGIILIIVVAAIIIVPRLFPQNNGELDRGIGIILPFQNERVYSPLKIIGYVNGNNWIGFEGQVGTVELKDGAGNVLAQDVLKATSEWMQTLVTFTADLPFDYPRSNTGTLVFHNENPSGLQEKDKELILPIRFGATSSEMMSLNVFFNNSKLDPEFSCNKVFPTIRQVPKTEAVARAALTELLKGATEEEKADGFFTSIPSDVKIQSLKVENGVAKADFDEKLEYQVGGSCRVSAIRSEITETLKQFSTVKSVVISINGRTEDILQP